MINVINNISGVELNFNQPFLIKKYQKEKFNLIDLKRILLNADVKFDVEVYDKDFKKSEIDFLEYIENILEDEEYPFYLSDFRYYLKTKVLDDILISRPAFIEENYLDNLSEEINPNLKWLFIGTKNNKTKLHSDIFNSSFWNILYEGKKIWYLFKTDYSSILKNYLYNDIYEIEDILIKESIKPEVVIQEEGDLLYLPSNHYHQVENLTNTIALTENIVSKNNISSVLKKLQHSNTEIFKIFYKILKQYEK